MKIMAPDDPTSVYPIGQTGLDDDDDDISEEDVAPATVPPIEPDVEAISAPKRAEQSGGFNPVIAVAVLGVGMLLAAGVLGLVTAVLLLLN